MLYSPLFCPKTASDNRLHLRVIFPSHKLCLEQLGPPGGIASSIRLYPSVSIWASVHRSTMHSPLFTELHPPVLLHGSEMGWSIINPSPTNVVYPAVALISLGACTLPAFSSLTSSPQSGRRWKRKMREMEIDGTWCVSKIRKEYNHKPPPKYIYTIPYPHTQHIQYNTKNSRHKGT